MNKKWKFFKNENSKNNFMRLYLQIRSEILTNDIKGQNINWTEHISVEFIDCGFWIDKNSWLYLIIRTGIFIVLKSLRNTEKSFEFYFNGHSSYWVSRNRRVKWWNIGFSIEAHSFYEKKIFKWLKTTGCDY